MDGVKLDPPNNVKAMLFVNNYFCKDFDKCVNFYKDFLKHSEITLSDTRRVSELSSSERDGSGSKKF